MIAPRIEDSFEKMEKYPTVVERYYSKYYFTPDGLPADETHCILVHSNKICLVTLAETHPVIRDKKTITKVNFQISEKLNRGDNKVTGKGKRGAQFMTPRSPLCFIECSDNSRYTVHGCVKGKLIEVNEQLLTNYQILVEKPLSNGYIAIILPNLKDIEEQKKGFELIRSSTAMKNESDLLEIDLC